MSTCSQDKCLVSNVQKSCPIDNLYALQELVFLSLWEVPLPGGRIGVGMVRICGEAPLFEPDQLVTKVLETEKKAKE